MYSDADAKGQSRVAKPYIEAEYNTLRDEILKRIELRQRSISILLPLAGIFLGVGITTETVALVYPPLAMFLALDWVQHDYRIKDLSEYIRENLESQTTGLGYETFIQQKRNRIRGLGSWRYISLSHGGTFLFTQLMAVGIEVAKMTFTPFEWVLIGIDTLAILTVVWLIRQSRRLREYGRT